ncbi:MAG: adenosylcobinamide-phosphate synthase CbiB [Candidatus Limnocylindrales bacterium]
MNRAGVLVASLAIDLALGEMPESGHPVVLAGRAVGSLAGRPSARPGRDLARGIVAVLLPTAIAWFVGRRVEQRARGPLGFVASVWLFKSAFSLRALVDAADRVADALEADDLGAARAALPWLVSRPVSTLDRAHIASAAVESLAENLADSYVAPICAYALGGLPAALAYRTVNTADAMIGYRDEREFQGKPAARLDDLINFVPARLTALSLVVAAGLTSGSAVPALGTALREARQTASPNAGWPMAAMAGALGIWLEKPSTYRLGSGRAPGAPDIRAARSLALVAAAVSTIAYLAWEVRR